MAKESAELAYRLEVTKLNTASQIQFAPIDGVIKRATISWPAGCNFLVEVLFNHKRTQILPTPGVGGMRGIALDNFTEAANPNWPVTRNDPIEMYLINHDSVNSHIIASVIHIEVE